MFTFTDGLPMNLRQCLGIGLVSLLSGLAMPASAEDFQIKIEKLEDLSFGSMLVVSTGTVTLDPQTGHISESPSVKHPQSLQKGMRTGPAKFELTCFRDKDDAQYRGKLKYKLSLNQKSMTIDIAGKGKGKGKADISLSDFQMYSSLNSSSSQLSSGREIDVGRCEGNQYRETIYVGATLKVDANQQPGHYSNDDLRLEVSFDYDD